MSKNVERYLSHGGLKLNEISIEDGVTKIKANQIVPKNAICTKCGGVHVRFNTANKVREYKESPLIMDGPTILQVVRIEGTCKDCGKRFTIPSPLIQNSRMTTFQKNWIKFLVKNPYGMNNIEIADEAYVDEKTIRRIRKEFEEKKQ